MQSFNPFITNPSDLFKPTRIYNLIFQKILLQTLGLQLPTSTLEFKTKNIQTYYIVLSYYIVNVNQVFWTKVHKVKPGTVLIFALTVWIQMEMSWLPRCGRHWFLSKCLCYLLGVSIISLLVSNGGQKPRRMRFFFSGFVASFGFYWNLRLPCKQLG